MRERKGYDTLKKLLTVLLALSMMAAMTASVLADSPDETAADPCLLPPCGTYALQINGKALEATACVMVPLRETAEALGFQVTWNNGTVLADDGSMHTEIAIGEDLYVVTTSVEGLVGMSAPFSLGVPPYVADGVTYVPLGLFDALLGRKEGTITVGGDSIQIRTEASASGESGGVRIPNPFQDCASLSDAEKIAGFSLAFPERLSGGFISSAIQAVSEDMIQVIYTSGEKEVLVRKAIGEGDISGDCHVYEESRTQSVGERTVTVLGSGGLIHTAAWSEGAYAYSISASTGLDSETLSALISAIH